MDAEFRSKIFCGINGLPKLEARHRLNYFVNINLRMLNTKYKTSMCRFYEESSHLITAEKECPLKEKCHFAHGDNELRGKSDVIFNYVAASC